MEQRLSLITLGVADMKRAKAFYDGLGWKAASGQPSEEIVVYDLHSMAIGLFPTEKLADEANVPMKGTGISNIALAHNVRSEADVLALLEKVEALGGTIQKPAEKVFWGGFSGYFTDPDGHLFEVAYNPFAKLGPNGEFQWNGVES